MSGAPGASSHAAAAAGRTASGSGSRSGNSSNSSAIINNRTGSSQGSSSRIARTLHDVMREPSTALPEILVLGSMPDISPRKDVLDPKEDLWLTTVDGRYGSPIIPVTVGQHPNQETFYVHKHILLKSDYFKKALCGEFRESGTQSIELPEEDPAIFHFLVAFLYEGKYEPIKPVASVLDPNQDKGKGVAGADDNADWESDSGSSVVSDMSVRSRRRRERRRRREDRAWERMRQKHPGTHRPNCNCPQCTGAANPPCWSCRAPRNPPHNYPIPQIADPYAVWDRQPPRRHPRRYHGDIPRPPPPPGPNRAAAAVPDAAGFQPPATPTDPNGGRIAGEDLRTWLLAYELNIDVYILANRYLLEDFKKAVSRHTIDMLETAGSDAGVVQVLYLCRKLYDGLPESDPLLKMVFARVGFLQPWRRAGFEREANEFLLGNPEIAPLLLREMAARREDEVSGRSLPSMVRPWYAGGGGDGNGMDGGGGGGGGQFGGGHPDPRRGGDGMIHFPVPGQPAGHRRRF